MMQIVLQGSNLFLTNYSSKSLNVITSYPSAPSLIVCMLFPFLQRFNFKTNCQFCASRRWEGQVVTLLQKNDKQQDSLMCCRICKQRSHFVFTSKLLRKHGIIESHIPSPAWPWTNNDIFCEEVNIECNCQHWQSSTRFEHSSCSELQQNETLIHILCMLHACIVVTQKHFCLSVMVALKLLCPCRLCAINIGLCAHGKRRGWPHPSSFLTTTAVSEGSYWKDRQEGSDGTVTLGELLRFLCWFLCWLLTW